MPRIRHFVALILFAGCCVYGRAIDYDRFTHSTLEQKISLYEDAIRRKCVTNDMLYLLRQIAAHGEPAADAMAALLREPNPYFPLEHAMIVFEFTRFEGVDLLEHDGMKELRRLAESHPDRKVRERAKRTIEEIEDSYRVQGKSGSPATRRAEWSRRAPHGISTTSCRV